jgi:hypothetical protein
MKSKIAAGNRCFCSLGQIFGSTAMITAVKIKMYEMMVKPVVVYGSETWPAIEMDMKRLNTWERIYGPVVEQGIWRIRTDQELWKLYKDLDIIADIKKK